ncbi:hypothetical protein Hanom_Chr08g00753491 [Helianthus anomalus]
MFNFIIKSIIPHAWRSLTSQRFHQRRPGISVESVIVLIWHRALAYTTPSYSQLCYRCCEYMVSTFGFKNYLFYHCHVKQVPTKSPFHVGILVIDLLPKSKHFVIHI